MPLTSLNQKFESGLFRAQRFHAPQQLRKPMPLQGLDLGFGDIGPLLICCCSCLGGVIQGAALGNAAVLAGFTARSFGGPNSPPTLAALTGARRDKHAGCRLHALDSLAHERGNVQSRRRSPPVC